MEKKIEFQNGTSLIFINRGYKKKREFQLGILPDLIEFSFFRSAKISFLFNKGRKQLSAGPLQSHLVYNRGMQGEGCIFASSLYCLTIYVPADSIPSDSLDYYSHENEPSDLLYFHSGSLTKGMDTIYNQLVSSSVDSFEQRLYIQAKCMELIALKLTQIKTENSKKYLFRNQEDNDRELASRAAFILLENIQKPPSLRELANEIGVSVSRLKLFFPKYYGVPPFEFLRRQRLVRAMELIKEKGANVSEAAHIVGYSEVSPFHRAFVKEFGVRPGECKPQRS
jgi:AraC family transcriptional regulator, transcriptional activator of the genes for pyochelin and ferripyochelin receptors